MGLQSLWVGISLHSVLNPTACICCCLKRSWSLISNWELQLYVVLGGQGLWSGKRLWGRGGWVNLCGSCFYHALMDACHHYGQKQEGTCQLYDLHKTEQEILVGNERETVCSSLLFSSQMVFRPLIDSLLTVINSALKWINLHLPLVLFTEQVNMHLWHIIAHCSYHSFISSCKWMRYFVVLQCHTNCLICVLFFNIWVRVKVVKVFFINTEPIKCLTRPYDDQ